MRFTDDMLVRIDRAYSEKRTEDGKYPRGLGVEVINSIGGAGVFVGKMHVCDLEDLEQVIHELTLMREVIKDTTGLY